jgi:hypothetical protein
MLEILLVMPVIEERKAAVEDVRPLFQDPSQLR